jgi:hypothetical protein
MPRVLRVERAKDNQKQERRAQSREHEQEKMPEKSVVSYQQ